VDAVTQRFEGTIHLGLQIPGGWADEDLKQFVAHGKSVDYVQEGKAVFGDEVKNSVNQHPDGSLHPSAAWYLSQIVFPNAVEHELMECSVHPPYGKGDNDMKLWIKMKGEFLEVMEMQNYPFDDQALTFSFGAQCRKGGAFPIEFIVADEDKLKKKKKSDPAARRI
jgi:hypothetical protein